MNHLTATGVRALAAGPGLADLRSVELNGNPVGEWVGELLRSRHLPALASVSASDVIGERPTGHDVVWAIVTAARPGCSGNWS